MKKFFFLRQLRRTNTPRGEKAQTQSPSPEFLSHKDDSTLQQQRGKDSDDLTYAQAAKQTVKVHMLQSGVAGPPQLDDLIHHNKKKGKKMTSSHISDLIHEKHVQKLFALSGRFKVECEKYFCCQQL